MAVVRARASDLELLARLMRAEAEGEGKQGMLMVGNVGVNRVTSNCLDFKGIRTIQQMVFQRPGGFESTMKPYFWSIRPRSVDKRLAQKVIQGKKFHPASFSLWFFKPAGDCYPEWFNQPFAGRFKSHCFYSPVAENCPGAYRY
jgi:N-acetylmuramoyl-L-alanine amidase